MENPESSITSSRVQRWLILLTQDKKALWKKAVSQDRMFILLQALQQASHIISEIRETHLWWWLSLPRTVNSTERSALAKLRRRFQLRRRVADTRKQAPLLCIDSWLFHLSIFFSWTTRCHDANKTLNSRTSRRFSFSHAHPQFRSLLSSFCVSNSEETQGNRNNKKNSFFISSIFFFWSTRAFNWKRKAMTVAHYFWKIYSLDVSSSSFKPAFCVSGWPKLAVLL